MALSKIRTASAAWRGTLAHGAGTVSTESGALDALPYAFATRFGDAAGTNPEELLGAAHAACFSMALANALAKAGHPADAVETTASVHLVQGEGGFDVPRIALVTRVQAPGVDADTFHRLAEETKAACPISKALRALEITLEAHLG